MPAPVAFELLRERVEARLASYAIKPTRPSGFKVVRICRSGESNLGFFLSEWAAVEYLHTRLMLKERR